jgi:hypothetical protein
MTHEIERIREQLRDAEVTAEKCGHSVLAYLIRIAIREANRIAASE